MALNWFEERLTLSEELASECPDAIDHHIESLEKEFISPTKNRFGVYSSRLQLIGSSLGLIALRQIHQEVPEGWITMATALDHLLGAFKVRHAAGFPARSWYDTNHLCQLFAVSYILEGNGGTSWLRNEVATGPGKPYLRWEKTPFEILILSVAHMESSRPVAFAGQIEASGYAGLSSADNAEEFTRALQKFDVFRGSLIDASQMDYPPFEFAPFDLFAVDVLVMMKMKGISLNDLHSPPAFLRSPINSPPYPFPFVRDPLVNRVLAAVQRERKVPSVSWC